MPLVTAPLRFFTVVTIILGECEAVFGLTSFVQRMRMLGAWFQCALAWGMLIPSECVFSEWYKMKTLTGPRVCIVETMREVLNYEPALRSLLIKVGESGLSRAVIYRFGGAAWWSGLVERFGGAAWWSGVVERFGERLGEDLNATMPAW